MTQDEFKNGPMPPMVKASDDLNDAILAMESVEAIRSAAERLSMDPLKLAEALQSGGIAELVTEYIVENTYLGEGECMMCGAQWDSPDDRGHNTECIIGKIRGHNADTD